VWIAILTLFPEALEPYTRSSILGIAKDKGLAQIRLIDFRDFTRDRHRTVDDRPFGGGPGMVLKPEPIFDCVEWLERREGPFRKLLLSPGGRTFDQAQAREYSREERLLILCGRYEGFDERIRLEMEWETVSIGDFVLAGGELCALAIAEATVRLLPGVLGHGESANQESFEPGSDPHAVLDHPQYTRPRTWRGHAVPDVLLGGDHAAIAAWRLAQSRARTKEQRPDLLARRGVERDLR
jgi:tRNA (guanine37-N1)-methyltransferase